MSDVPERVGGEDALSLALYARHGVGGDASILAVLGARAAEFVGEAPNCVLAGCHSGAGRTAASLRSR